MCDFTFSNKTKLDKKTFYQAPQQYRGLHKDYMELTKNEIWHKVQDLMQLTQPTRIPASLSLECLEIS